MEGIEGSGDVQMKTGDSVAGAAGSIDISGGDSGGEGRTGGSVSIAAGKGGKDGKDGSEATGASMDLTGTALGVSLEALGGDAVVSAASGEVEPSGATMSASSVSDVKIVVGADITSAAASSVVWRLARTYHRGREEREPERQQCCGERHGGHLLSSAKGDVGVSSESGAAVLSGGSSCPWAPRRRRPAPLAMCLWLQAICEG